MTATASVHKSPLMMTSKQAGFRPNLLEIGPIIGQLIKLDMPWTSVKSSSLLAAFFCASLYKLWSVELCLSSCARTHVRMMPSESTAYGTGVLQAKRCRHDHDRDHRRRHRHDHWHDHDHWHTLLAQGTGQSPVSHRSVTGQSPVSASSMPLTSTAHSCDSDVPCTCQRVCLEAE